MIALQHRIFRSIGRFFEGIGSVIATPSGDARSRLKVPIDTMYDISAAQRFMGH